MFSWLANFLAVKPRASAPQALRAVRARYDAAVTNEDNRRHWANADGLSAIRTMRFATNSPRATDCKGYLTASVTDGIGRDKMATAIVAAPK